MPNVLRSLFSLVKCRGRRKNRLWVFVFVLIVIVLPMQMRFLHLDNVKGMENSELRERLDKMLDINMQGFSNIVNTTKYTPEKGFPVGAKNRSIVTVIDLQAPTTEARNTKMAGLPVQEAVSTTTTTTTQPILPQWVHRFNLPKIKFQPTKTPIVFFSNYRHQYLSKCLDSMARSANDMDPSTACIFVLHRTKTSTDKQVGDTLEAIANVTFCKTYLWEVNKNDKPAVLSAAHYKRHWWNVIRKIFGREGDFESLLASWDGNNILILEEDIVLAEDFIRVYWYASRILSTVQFSLPVAQVALGGWSGENLINAHPDTFVIRTSIYFQPMAYSFTSSFYQFLWRHESKWLNDQNADFSGSLADLVRGSGVPLLVVVPTMGRMWHIGAKGMGLTGTGQLRPIEKNPPWKQTHRFIDLDKAELNLGVRDVWGFLCQSIVFDKVTKRDSYLCPGSSDKKSKLDLFKITCMKQPFVNDRCVVDQSQNTNST